MKTVRVALKIGWLAACLLFGFLVRALRYPFVALWKKRTELASSLRRRALPFSMAFCLFLLFGFAQFVWGLALETWTPGGERFLYYLPAVIVFVSGGLFARTRATTEAVAGIYPLMILSVGAAVSGSWSWSGWLALSLASLSLMVAQSWIRWPRAQTPPFALKKALRDYGVTAVLVVAMESVLGTGLSASTVPPLSDWPKLTYARATPHAPWWATTRPFRPQNERALRRFSLSILSRPLPAK